MSLINNPQMNKFMAKLAYDMEVAMQQGNKLREMTEKFDSRLFPDYLLYCEGLERPAMRGMLHLFCAIILPLGLYHLYIEANGSFVGQAAAALYVLSNLWCFLTSGLYHVGRWSVNTEILLQKLDHCGIAIFSMGTNMPVALLLLPFPFGALLALLSIAACLWNCYHIWKLQPAVWRLVVKASIIIVFVPVSFWYMNEVEFRCMLANAALQGLGVAIFINRYPNPWPKVFGYHEVFHFVCVLGACNIYMCNWSVIRRTCNPYARHLDVVEILISSVIKALDRGT